MRLRSGGRSSDSLTSKFAFVTTNAAFVRYAREFCRDNRMINERQVPPVLLQRELATTAWLRTGLTGAADELRKEIPRSHLIASCERVLRPRREVVKAVHDTLNSFAPEKAAQYELLLSDQRSVQRLMDETLNIETLVTADSAEKLLEEMKRATAQEIHDEYELKFRQQAQRHGQQKKDLEARAVANQNTQREIAAAELAEKDRELQAGDQRFYNLKTESDRLQQVAAAARETDAQRVDAILLAINRKTRHLDFALLIATWLLVLAAFFGTTVGLGAGQGAITAAGVIVALIGVYHMVQELRQRPKFGFENILNYAASRGFRSQLRAMHLDETTYENAITVYYGRLEWNAGAREQLLSLTPPVMVREDRLGS